MAQPWKPRESSVCTDESRIGLESERCKVCVVNVVPAQVQVRAQLLKPLLVSGVRFEPPVGGHLPQGCEEGECVAQGGRSRAQCRKRDDPHQRQLDERGNSDLTARRQRVREPSVARRMVGTIPAKRVDQNIHIQNKHGAAIYLRRRTGGLISRTAKSCSRSDVRISALRSPGDSPNWLVSLP